MNLKNVSEFSDFLLISARHEAEYHPIDRFYLERYIDKIKQFNKRDFLLHNFNYGLLYSVQLKFDLFDMNNFARIILLLLISFLSSCQSNSKMKTSVTEYFVPQGIDIMLSFNSSYEGDDPTRVSFNSIIKRKLSGQVITMSGDAIVGILSFREGAVWGEELSTYADGSLKKYAFRHNAQDAVFYRKYDSLRHVIGEQGTPCVGHFAHEYSNGDSLRSDVLFVDGIFEDMKIELSTDGVSFKKIDTYDNANYTPYKLYRHRSSLRCQDDEKLYFRMSCIDSITKERLLFKDSVSLSAYKK